MSTKRFAALTPKQRSYLAQLAKTAHTTLTRCGAIDEPFDAWRKREAMQASKGFTISEAPKHCFDDLEQHFLALAGKSAQAFDRALGPTNEERTLQHEIDAHALDAGVGERYVAGICRRMFGTPKWSGAGQGKKVLIALKQLAKRRKAQAQTPTP